jgi:hypothetical protein
LTRESATGEERQDIQEVFRRTSTALVEVKKSLAVLESGNRSSADLDSQVARGQVESLRTELALLNTKLSTLQINTTGNPELVDSLAVGIPEMPTPVIPIRLRDTILVGAVIGIGIAWVILNFRWLVKRVSSSPEKKEEDDA